MTEKSSDITIISSGTSPVEQPTKQTTCLAEALISAFQTLGRQLSDDSVEVIMQERAEMRKTKTPKEKLFDFLGADLEYAQELAEKHNMNVEPKVVRTLDELSDLVSQQTLAVIPTLHVEHEAHAVHLKAINTEGKADTNEGEHPIEYFLYGMAFVEGNLYNCLIVSPKEE